MEKKILKWLYGTFIKLIAFRAFGSFTTRDGHSFRITGFYYSYRFKSGDRKLISCPKIFANTIGGYGACGWYIPFSEVKSVSFKFKNRWWFYKEDKHPYEWSTLWYYFFEKQGLDSRYFMDKAIEKTMKSLRKKSY